NYYLGGGGSCVYKTVTTCTGTGSTDCSTSNGTWNSTTCVCTCPNNYTLNGTKCEANLSLTCTKDQWTCDNWSVCVSGKQYRPCTLSFDCPGVTEVSPRTEQDCTVASGTEETTEATNCYYKLSDYGDCINGVKTRKVLSSYPEGCIDTLTEPLEKSCTSTACSYKYSAWGECKNGKRTRNVTSTTPNGCTPGNPIIEETCKSVCTDNDWKCEDWGECASEGTQYRKCSLLDTCISSTASVLKSPQTTRTCLYTKEEQTTTETTVETEEALPAECLKVGFDNKNDCELYLYQSRIVSDCQSSGLTTQDQCREYLLSKYGKPLKCQSLSENECNSLINNVILSDLSSVISSETKDSLNEVAGMSAVIDTQAKTIIVSIKKTPIAGGNTTEQIKEIKVDSLPITSSDSEQVSVNLVSVGSTSSQQQSLSPVAIIFDSNQNGISDDLDSRLGDEGLTTAVKESLTGVDKAIVDGKTLEQPKYAEVTTSASLVVSSVTTVKTEDNKSNLKFEGKAEPNQIVTLFIYSTMPIVVTVQADANGNWTYELDKTMVDGTHEVYVAINNDEGAIVEASLPTPFFIQEAQAVSVDDFVATTGDATEVSGQTNTLMMLYIFSGIAIILILIAAFLIIKQRMSDE
ncbi:MAG: Ig-like domain-containing protein, partial [Minisyncoccales bacterium]